MNTTKTGTANLIFAALAGGSIFGLAMAFRESTEDEWLRAAIASAGAVVGVGVALVIRRFRKQPEA